MKSLEKILKEKNMFSWGYFKPNTDDMREASSLKMIPYLSKKGAVVRYHDPSGEKEFFKNKKCFF